MGGQPILGERGEQPHEGLGPLLLEVEPSGIASGLRMTGIRPCTGATTPLASHVRSVHDSTGSSPLSHRSQSPANAKGLLSLSRK